MHQYRNNTSSIESRLIVVLALFGVMWFLIVGITFHIQIVKADYFSKKSDRQSTQRQVVLPERGTIYDRNGTVLVKTHIESVKDNSVRRFLPYGKLGSQVLGHLGRDGKGMLGVERYFDNQLRGIDGWRYKKVDVKRRIYEGMQLDGAAPVAGLDVVLTIDKEIQHIAEGALERGVKKVKADRGTAVVIDPHTGEILAMASYPDYDPNDLSKLDLSATKNDVVAKVYEPGSTFKVVAAAAAIEERIMQSNDSINGNMGVYKIYGDVIRDTHKYGWISFADAMAFSSNVGFAQVATKVGKEDYFRYVRRFGFGTKTGIQIPGEEKGRLKNISRWSGRTLVTMAMGHEIMTTPLQVAMAYGTVANGGELLKPRIVRQLRERTTGEVVLDNPKQTIRRVISEETASELRNMLAGVVKYGTARNLQSDIISTAGKTGTAEKYSVDKKRYIRSSMNSSFIGMVPAAHPQYVCMVVIDEPRTFTSGARTAGPVFKEIMEKVQVSPRINRQGLRGTFVKTLPATDPKDVMSQDDQVEKRTIMPNLKGKSLREAVALMAGRGVVVDFSGSGWVVNQSPEMGDLLGTRSKCTITLMENI
ncbi:MAG: transpeptidase family protein [Fibrobacterales bacterium]